MEGGVLNALNGWHRTGFQLRGLAQGYAPVLAVSIPATFNDVATNSVAPITTAGDSIPLDIDGYCIRIDTAGGQTIADPTRLVVNTARAGYSGVTGAGPTLNADQIFGTKLLRRTFPFQASPILATGSSFLLALDDLLHQPDTILSVRLLAGFFAGQTRDIVIPGQVITRLDTIQYDRPMLRPAIPPFRRVSGNSFRVEFNCVNRWATAGGAVARVEATWKRGGTYGPWAGSNTMVRSAGTPASGRAPSGLATPVYEVDIDFTTCPDSSSRGDTIIVYRGYSAYGNAIFDSELHGDALQANGLPSSVSPPAGLPVIVDKAGNHTAVYAWVNRDGTGLAGTSAAGVSTSTADPGAALSYQSEAAALAAIRLWNSNAANRAATHNTTSGAHVMFRDVPGSAMGDSATAYWQRASLSGFSDGLRPPIFQSATHLASGNSTAACRRRGVQDNGSTAATSKNVAGVFEWRGIIFDATGLTGASHQITDGQSGGAATSVATATTGTITIDCDIHENRTAGTSFNALSRPGWRWDVRTTVNNPCGNASLVNLPLNFAGLMLAQGCVYRSDLFNNLALQPINLGGCLIQNLIIVDQSAGTAPDLRDGVLVHIRLEADQPTQALLRLAEDAGRTRLRRGICGMLIRKTGTNSGPLVQIGADGQLNPFDGYVLQHISLDAGDDATADADRANLAYGDQSYIQAIKRLVFQYCAFGSINLKDGVFDAPEAPGLGSFTTGWAASTRYVRGDLRHDNNATATARLWFVAIADFTSGTSQATDLADASRWQALGAVHGVRFGGQPRRTGNWRARHHVGCYGNVMARSASSTPGTGVGPDSWVGEALGRGSQLLQFVDATARSRYFRRRTGGSLSTFADAGDYRPQSIAAGDAADSPLLGRVPAGRAVRPFDLIGTPALNDGRGAAGAYERVA